MIRITKTDEGRSAPTITCDQCGKLIDEAKWGNCHWKTRDGNLTEDGKLYFTHKQCCTAFESADSSIMWHSTELTAFLRRLVHNLKADLSEDIGDRMLDQLP